jgi:hypothetical protein
LWTYTFWFKFWNKWDKEINSMVGFFSFLKYLLNVSLDLFLAVLHIITFSADNDISRWCRYHKVFWMLCVGRFIKLKYSTFSFNLKSGRKRFINKEVWQSASCHTLYAKKRHWKLEGGPEKLVRNSSGTTLRFIFFRIAHFL